MKRILIVLLMACPAFSAGAANVLVDGSRATGILGLDVDGTRYDIFFDSTTTPFQIDTSGFAFIGDTTGAQNTAAAIVAELNAAGGINMVGEAADPVSWFVVPYSDPSALTVALTWWGSFDKAPGPAAAGCTAGVWAVCVDEAVETTVSIGPAWVTMTPTVVPVPAAFWLFGSALGLLGWIRHKIA